MTEIAFHFNATDKNHYVCRLLRKVWRMQQRVIVCVPDERLKELDAQLWTFEPTGFLPHCHRNDEPELLANSAIILTSDLSAVETLPHHQILVNLCDQVQNGYETFERVIEIVTQDEQDKLCSRQRWKHYSDRGYPIVKYDLAQSKAKSNE
ncbi:MAG: DNA polymerase III subunit chi [Betaproteobacteria bacterium]|jgi:DNA polymerase III subunit chi|nr:DNA polymerase III subunit chi [Betaproteobacteria bacterium]NBT66890.1 DNA polymerase III subunit chi [Betaproteobacteria bacterium]NBY08512.1 DNA polymerase III subunit chi [Betaproteobacteria bacterium]